MEAPTDPEACRRLWESLLQKKDERAEHAVEAVLASAVIDLITNEMAKHDEYARVIGNRIATMMTALGL